MHKYLEVSSTQHSYSATSSMNGTTTPFSWTNDQPDIFLWSENLMRAWDEQRFNDVMVQIDEYLNRLVPFVNDLLIAIGLYGKANCHLMMNRYSQALDFIEQTQCKLDAHSSTMDEFFGSAKADEGKTFLNQYKGFLLLNLGREEEAIEILRENPPKVWFIQQIYRDIEDKLGVGLSDSNESSSSYPSFSWDSDFPGLGREVFDKLIGEWLKK